MARIKKILFSFFAAVLFTFAGIGTVWAGAEDSVSVTSIDYEKLTLTVQGNGDSTFYFSDYKQKKWEKIVGAEKDGAVTMDISWVPVAKNYVLALKGDQSTKPITVTLPKYNTAFKVVYDKKTGQVTSYKGLDSYKGDKVQWRVKGTSEWKEDYIKDTENNINGLKKELDTYINEIAAVTVYFRTKPLAMGEKGAEAGQRPSKEVKVTIAKKTAAPAVTLNGSTAYLTVPAGVEYRKIGDGWSEPTKEKGTKPLSDFGWNIPNSEAGRFVAEFRKVATANAQVSASKFIYFNPQRDETEIGLGKTDIKFLSPTRAEVKVELDEKFKDEAYEYTVSKEAPDISSKWTTMKVKSEGGVYYLSQTFSSSVFSLKEGTSLYIRAKASGKSGDKDLKFASKPYIVSPFDYPGSSTLGAGGKGTIVGIHGTKYGISGGLNLSYTVAAGVEGDTTVSAINVYKSGTLVTALSNGTDENEYFETSALGSDYNKENPVTRQVQIHEAGITALLENSKLVADKGYVLELVLANDEKIMTEVNLQVLSPTKISSTGEYTKIDGFDSKECTVTLDYGNKDPNDYNISIGSGNSTATDLKTVRKEENGKFTQVITFTLSKDQQYFAEDSDVTELDVVITNKDASLNLSETIKGPKVKREQPIVSSQSGSISFTKGDCAQDVTLTFTLNSSSQVTGSFGVTEIRWGEKNTFTNGYTVTTEGTKGEVLLSKDLLNSLSDGSGNIRFMINNKVVYETNYMITVMPNTGSTETLNAGSGTGGGSTASLLSRNSFRLMAESEESEGGKDADVTIDSIDYGNNKLNLTLNSDMVFYSVNKKTWYGIGDRDIEELKSKTCAFDISWVSDTKNYTIYFKGVDSESESEYASVTLPKKNKDLKVKFDKTSDADTPTLTITNADGAKLEWRKKASYEWEEFVPEAGIIELKELEYLRVKGGKIIVRAQAADGKDGSAGTRYSKEVTVNIPKRANAPAVKINVSKMRVNTTTALEYLSGNEWVACTKNMGIWEFKEVNDNVKAGTSAGTNVTISFRKAAKKKAGYSKVQEVVFQGQALAPSVSATEGDEVEYSEEKKVVNKKEVTKRYLKFNKASKTVRYQYVVVPQGVTFEEGTAKWNTVSKVKKVTLNSKAVPGATIYVRILGTAAKASTPAQLSSAWVAYLISEAPAQAPTDSPDTE